MTQEEIAKQIWDDWSCDAEWEGYDRVDDYCLACGIYLEVDGYIFEGEGQIVCGDREIEYVDCTCPNGSVVRVA